MAGLFDEYVEGGARRFFDGHPARPEDRLRAVQAASRPLDPAVAEALRAQHARLPPSRARSAQVDALCSGAAAVVTGQQAGLFLGPLYTIAKAASAIRIASALQEESGRPVVPVFWLQVEDHDLPEIAEIRVAAGPGLEPVVLRLQVPSDNRVSIAHLGLPGEIEALTDALEAALVPLPHAAGHVNLIKRYYQPGVTWGDAFTGVLAELFADEGLIIVSPRDEALARAVAPVHRHALLHAREISDALATRGEELRAAGHDETVRPRAGSPLSFYHPKGASGPRFRLEPCGEGSGGRTRWTEVGGTGSHSTDDLLVSLERDPLTFSSSALLRPIVQDTLLPTAAYVGGPGEIAYLAQVAPLYRSFGLPMPLMVPRARIRVIDDPTARLLERHGLCSGDAAACEDDLLARCRVPDPRRPSRESVEAALLAPFRDALVSMTPVLCDSGQGLDKAIHRADAAVEQAVSKLSAKYASALLHRDERLVDEVRRLRLALFPCDQPQERMLGVASFAARHGGRAFVRLVLESIEPFDFTPRDIT